MSPFLRSKKFCDIQQHFSENVLELFLELALKGDISIFGNGLR